VSKGVPAKPARGRQHPSGTPTTSSTTSTSSASGKRVAHRAEAPQDPGIDLDALARRLLDPMARLLRTELRRGRERTGRPYDGRR
jgi:syndecan 1